MDERLEMELSFSAVEKTPLPTGNFHQLPRHSFIQYSVHDIITPSKKGDEARIRVQQVTFGVDVPRESCVIKQYQTEYPTRLDRTFNSPRRHLNSSLAMLTDGKCSSSEFKSQVMNTSMPVTLSSRSHPIHDEVVTERKRNGLPSKKLKRSLDISTSNEPKKRIPKSIDVKEKHFKQRNLHWKYILLLPLLPLTLLLGLWLLIYQGQLISSYHTCNGPLDLSLVKQALQKDVFGQDYAVKKLIRLLENHVKPNGEILQPPLILMSGGNGVGKSLTSSILSKNFPPPGMAQYLMAPSLPSEDEVLQAFSLCGENLLIIDNLMIHHSLTDIIDWVVKMRSEATWQGKIVWILLVFNVQGWIENLNEISYRDYNALIQTGSEQLLRKFISNGLDSHVVQFVSLSDKHVEECIRKALEKRGIHDSEAFKTALQLLSTSGSHAQGCKRVWSQVVALG